jgi:hypothetical protein
MVDKKSIYKVSPINVHVPTCVHETMELSPDGLQVIYKKWLFTQSNFKCGGCNSSDDVVFMRTSPLNEVMRSCTYCGVTQPISIKDERGNIVADNDPFKNETHVMTIDEIRDFIIRNKFINDRIKAMLKVQRVKRKVNVEELGLETE